MPYSFKTLPPWHEVESEIRSRGYGDAEVEQARQRYWTDLSGADDFQALGPERGEAIRSRLFNEPITPVPGGSRQPEGPATSPAELYGRAPLSASPVPTSAASTPSELYGSLKPRLASAHQPEPESGKGWIEAAPDPTERMVYAPSSPRRIPWQEQTPGLEPAWGPPGRRGLSPEQEDALSSIAIAASTPAPQHGTLREMLSAARDRGWLGLNSSALQQQLMGAMGETQQEREARLAGEPEDWAPRLDAHPLMGFIDNAPPRTRERIMADLQQLAAQESQLPPRPYAQVGTLAHAADDPVSAAMNVLEQLPTTGALMAQAAPISALGGMMGLGPVAATMLGGAVAAVPEAAAEGGQAMQQMTPPGGDIPPEAIRAANKIFLVDVPIIAGMNALEYGLAAGTGFGKGLLSRAVGRSPVVGQWMRSMTGAAAKGLVETLGTIAAEGGMEGAEEWLQQSAQQWAAGQSQFWTPDNPQLAAEREAAFTQGALQSLALSGPATVSSTIRAGNEMADAALKRAEARSAGAQEQGAAPTKGVPPNAVPVEPTDNQAVSEKPQSPLYLIRTNRDLGPVEIVEERERGRVLVRDRAGKDRSVFRKQLEEYRPPEEPPDAPPVAPQGPPPQGPPPQAPPAPPVVEAPPAASAPVAPQLAYYGVKGRPEWGPVVITDDSDRSAVEVQPVSGGAPRRVGRKAIEPWTGEVPALAAPPVEPPAEQPAATVTQTVNTSEQVPTVSRPDRRQDTEMRAALAAMNPEDMTPEQRIEAIRLHREELRTDQLTKILNRRAWDEDRASTSEPRGYGALDLDDFKKFQDQTGEPDHQAGDQVLVGVASRLREVGQKHGVTIYRTGGDEFSAIGPTTEHVQAALTEAYESLQKDRVGATLRSGVRVESPVLFSFGVGKNPEEADAAAGRAKAERKRAAGSATETGRGPGRVAPAVEPGLRSGEGGVPPGTGPAEEVASGEDFSARSKYPDGRLVPQVGDEVYQMVAGFGGTAAYIHGKVVGNKNRTYVVVTGSAAMVGEAQKGKKHKLTPQWTVRNDPEIARREAEREAKRVAEKAESDAAQSQYEERTASSIADARASGAEMLSGVTPTLGMRIVSHFGGVQRSGTITNIDDAGRPYAVFDDENGGQPYDIAGVSAGQEAPGGFLGNDLSTYTVEPAPAPTAPPPAESEMGYPPELLAHAEMVERFRDAVYELTSQIAAAEALRTEADQAVRKAIHSGRRRDAEKYQDKRRNLGDRISELKARLDAVRDNERAYRDQGHDVEEYDYSRYVREGKPLPPERRENYTRGINRPAAVAPTDTPVAVTPEPPPTITFPDLMARVARATTPEELDTLQRTAETTATTNGQRMMAESQKFQASMKVARERVTRPGKQGAAGEVAGTATPSRTAKIVDRLRKLAAGMDATIADKRRPTTQNMTPRRARMESSRFDDANRLESIQTLMLRIADAMEAGTLAQPLRDIDLSNRAVIEQLHSAATHKTKSGAAYYHESHLKDWLRDSEGLRGVKDERAIVNRLLARRGEHGSRTYDPKDIAAIHRLVDAIKKAGKRVFFQIPSEEVVVRAGVRSDEQWVQVRDAIAELIAPKKESEADRVRKLERELVGVKIPGFFPTPRPVIDRMLEEADIQPGQSVLEPSAGKGDIADAIREHGVTPDTIEYSDTLAKVLEAKGYTPKVADFLEQTGQYDRVVMNPPFEQGQDIDHVRHAFTMLKPGGRLVAIMSEGPFFRSDKKATEFREWLDSVNGTSEQLPAGSFTGAEAFRQTGAATRLVVIEKPEAVVSSTAGSSENRHVAAYDSRVSRNMASDAYSRVPLGPHSREILSRIGPFIPEDILPGSGAADGWIYGWLGAERGDTSPRDMGMGGGVYSSTVRGFNAYYEQHQPAIGETGTPDEIVAALESLPQPGGLSRPEGISLLQKLGFAVEPTVRRANSEDVGRLYLMLKRKEITRQEYQAGIRNSYDTNGNPLGSEPVTPKPTGIPGQLPEPLSTIRREFKRTTPAAQEHFDALIRERDALSSRIEKIREPEAEANRVAGDMQKRARRSGSQKQWRAYEKLRDAVIAESHRVQGLVKPLVERRNDIEEQMYRWHLENAAESGDPLRSIPALVKLAEDMGRDERGAYSAGKKELASIIRAHLLDEGYTPEEIGTEDEYAADSALEQPASRDNENKVQLARSRIVGVMQNRLADRIRTENRFLEAAVADDYGPGAVPKSGIYSRREAVKNASRMPSTLEQVRAATADMDALVEIGRAVIERQEAESRREQAELTAIRERLEGRVIDPTPEETAEVAAGSKKTDTTGFTPKQKEYIAEKLEEVYPELPDGPIGRGLAINVPGDGQIRVNSKEGADRLHKTLAKEPIGDVAVDRLRPIPDFSLGSELPAAAIEDWERAVNPGDPGAAKALLRELLSALEASGQGDSAKANRVRTLLGIAGKRAEKPGVVQLYDDDGNPLKVIKGEPIPIPGFEGIEFVLVKERAGFVLYEKSSGLSAYSYPGARDREEFVAAAIASLQKLGRPTVEQAIADGIAKRQGVAHQTVDQTETPEFRRWFGDSVVVDEAGRPLVVYHGTWGAGRPDFSVFSESFIGSQTDSGYFGRGFYFTTDPEYADAYAGSYGGNRYEPGARIMPVFLSIRNPYFIPWNGGVRTASSPGDTTADLIERGYDGVKIQKDPKYGDWYEWVAFRPEQIKSATGNRGTFDPANPDIRYQTGQPAIPVTLTADTLREHFPGAKVSDVEGGYELRLPGKEPITVREVNRIQPDADALAQHGQTLEDVRAGRVLITAAYVPGGLSGQDVVLLARNRWDATSIPHERMHMAFRLALTEKERAALIKKFGSEEGAAKAAESWKPGQGGLFHKVYLFFRRLAQAVFGPQWENVFADVASGDVWARERKAEPGRLEYEAAQARELAPPWYSKLQRTLEEKLPARASADQVRGVVRSGGVKPEEVEWSGLEEYLAEHPQVVKAELLDALRASQVEVQEVVRVGPARYEGQPLFQARPRTPTQVRDTTGRDARYAELERRARVGDKDAEAEAQRMVDEAARAAGAVPFDLTPDDIVEAQSIEPRHETNRPAHADVMRSVMRNGWVGRPVLVLDDGGTLYGKTGVHRLQVARDLDIDVPVVIVDYSELDRRLSESGQYSGSVEEWDRLREEQMEGDLRSLGFEKAADLLFIEYESNWADDEDTAVSTGPKSAFSGNILRLGGKVKSAAPFTYRNDGTLIPLGERFNPQSPDIRFQIRTPRAPWEVPDETRFQKIRRKAQDKFLRFAKTQEAIEGQTGETITDEQDVALATELRRSRAGNRLEKMEVAHVKPIALLVRQLGKAGVSWKQVNEWLYARHAGERNAALMQDRIDEADRRGTPLDLDDPEVQASISGLSGMSNEEAREVLAQYTGARQALLEQLGAKVDALTRAKLAWMVEDGLLTQEAVDAMQARYQHYVPLKGISGEEDIAEALGGDEGPRMHTGRGLDVRGVEVRRAKGRHSRATHDIISQLVMDAEESVVRGEKNRVGETLGRLMKEFPNSEAWEFYRPRRSVKVGPGGRVYSIPATWEADRETLVVAYKDRGRQVFVRFKDPLMARAYKNLGPVNLPKFMELVAKTTRFYAAVRTQINPEWWITNFMRDFQEASINLSTEDARGMGREVRRNTFRAIAGILGAETGAKWQAQWQRYFSEYQEDGAQVRFLDFRNLESQQDRLMRMAHAEGNAAWLATKEAAQTIGDVISGFNLAIENGVRLSAYVAARNRGMSRARAAAMAKNLTVNFEKHGEWGPTVSSLWAFANANVQGPARMMMALSSPRVWKIMGAMASLGAAVAMYGALYGGEDDEDGRRYWDKIPAATKERFLPLLIPGTKGKYIPIPMPYGYSWPMVASFALVDDILLPKLAPTPTHQKVDPLRAAFNTMAGVANSFNPLGGLSTETGAQLAISAIPSVGQPFARAAINEDQFGRQIAPSGIPFGPQQPDSSKAWASTPQWARKTAAALNAATGGNAHRSGKLDFSPDSLEYIMDEAVGGLGKFVHGAAETSVALATGATPELRKVPFARKAVATVGDYAVSREYRDAINEIETLRAELKDAVGPAREAFLRKHRPVLALSDAAKAFEKELDTLRKAHKDRPSDELKRRMTSLQKRFLKRYLTATQTAD